MSTTIAVAATIWSCVAPYGFAMTAEMKEVLDKHNVYRCMHGVPSFVWDDAIAANAQAWADVGNYEHSAASARVVGGEQLGENLAWGTPSYTGTASTVAWYSEIKFTKPYGTADSFNDAVPANEAIGHYTQVVWSSSTKLGCGKGKATVNGAYGDYWVCQYGPAGNYGGEFKAKVLAPTKTVTSCGGTSVDVPTGGTSPGNGLGAPGFAPTPTQAPSNTCDVAPPDHSRGKCETCFHGDQCPNGYYCCPYMKKCVDSSSMPCNFPIASCSPMCYDSMCNKATGCTCPQCNKRAKDDWLAWATQLNSNSQNPEKAPCSPIPTPAPKGGASSASRVILRGCLTLTFTFANMAAQGVFA